MKKLATAFIVAGLGLFALVPAAFATQSNNDLPNGTHLKVDICHNVDHNPHIVPVSINAAKASQETGHGLLTLGAGYSFVSFLPHVGTGGHQHDFVARVYTKHGNTEHNTYVSERQCGGEENTTTTTEPPTTTTTQPPVTTTTTEPPVVTTTTQPPVTTTTQPPVVTTTTEPPATVTTVTEAPHNECLINGFVVKTDQACPVAPVAPVTSVTALPHTGAWSLFLALIGAAAGLLGIGLMLMSSAMKRANN